MKLKRDELEKRQVKRLASRTDSEKKAYALFIKMKIPVYVEEIIGWYICDFVGIDRPFILEIDGSSHKDREEYDGQRDDLLTYYGFTVFRIENKDVTEEGIKDRVLWVPWKGRDYVKYLIAKHQIL